MPEGVRVRFAPSPTGDLHVGNVRTALYNWAYARHTGGTFVFRIEDTDRTRVTEEGAAAAVSTLRWLGLDWDEGPEVGGPHGPYYQSERRHIYADWTERFVANGDAYHCYCTPEEVEARNRAAGRPPGYDGHCRTLTSRQAAAYEAEGRRPVVRFRMPEGSTTFHDLIRGEVSFDHEHVPDFVLVRGDGHPLYTLAVAVDDVLMGITHILRGEDLLSSTPRQIAVYAAMGVPADRQPVFAHLPFVMGHDNTKLSKRHGEVSVAWYRREGFVPEAVVNYLALLGWSLPNGEEVFTLHDMVASFEIGRINKSPARFDIKKLEALNGDHIRRLSVEELTARVLPVLQHAGLVSHPPSQEQERVLRAGVPLLRTRMRRLTEASRMLGFLLVPEDRFVRDEADEAKTLIPPARDVIELALATLERLDEWSEPAVNAALRAALDERGLKTKTAFPPLYVAVVGYRSGPPLFDSLALLGRERTLGRLRAALDAVPAG